MEELCAAYIFGTIVWAESYQTCKAILAALIYYFNYIYNGARMKTKFFRLIRHQDRGGRKSQLLILLVDGIIYQNVWPERPPIYP